MRQWLPLGAVAALAACASAPDGPGVVDPAPTETAYTITLDRPVEPRVRGAVVFEGPGVWFSDDLPGGRLSDIRLEEDTLFTALIRPENAPINNSAWYAFQLWSDQPRTVVVRLGYEDGRHRYWPKIRVAGGPWMPLAEEAVQVDTAANAATLRLPAGPDTVWVAAQKLITSAAFQRWTDSLAVLPHVSKAEIGRSRGGRAIEMLTITDDPDASRHVYLISRQHPPEVTGTIALMRFVEEIAGESPLARTFRRHFQTRAVPLVNPDGVDLGHWRHNLGGVDLNRDWVAFHQPETRAVRDALLRAREETDGDVWFAADFHSTRRDLFYTLDRAYETAPAGFIDRWLDQIRSAVPDFHVDDAPTGLVAPTSRNWFYREFGAPAVTYEVGDDTDPDVIRAVATAAARAMMVLLLQEAGHDVDAAGRPTTSG